MPHGYDQNNHLGVSDAANDPVVPDAVAPQTSEPAPEIFPETARIGFRGNFFIQKSQNFRLRVAPEFLSSLRALASNL
jgi:hypothetical protein